MAISLNCVKRKIMASSLMSEKVAQPQDKYIVRFPDGMRDRLKTEAAKSGRSLNAEIVHRLANSLSNPSFSDFAIGLGEDLDFQLMLAAGRSGRSLREEMIYRLEQSLKPEQTLLNELEDRIWEIKKKYDELLKHHIQLTPEERRLLEERSEIAESARKLKISSKDIGKFVRLNPIGNRGRFVLTIPQSDYSPIFGGHATQDDMQLLIDDAKTIPDEDD